MPRAEVVHKFRSSGRECLIAVVNMGHTFGLHYVAYAKTHYSPDEWDKHTDGGLMGEGVIQVHGGVTYHEDEWVGIDFGHGYDKCSMLGTIVNDDIGETTWNEYDVLEETRKLAKEVSKAEKKFFE